MTRESRLRIAHAYKLVDAARTREEQEAAHVAMVAAFPSIAAAYPCYCDSCERERDTQRERYRSRR